ncbi:hypothetical protein D3C72_1666460 [compost metagenome]
MCGGFYGFLILRCEGAECVLHAVAQLPQNVVRNIRRVLRDEIHPDAFRANQADHLFDFIQQDLWSIAKQQMRFVKEKHQLGFVEIARFRQLFIKF